MRSAIAIVCATFVASATSTQAGLSFGMYAELDFQQLHTDLGGNYLDFESVPQGTNLLPGQDPFGVGARFASIVYTNGNPFGPEHVEVSNRHRFAEFGNSLVGSPFQHGSDDARVGDEVAFDDPQARAGLRRIWNTSSLTQFYNAAGELLGEHQNTTSAEFVGWIGEAGDQSTWVARIVMDTVAPPSSRQVGHSDDLYFGTDVPAPGAIAVLSLAGIAGMRRRR
jgi:MYXO-CTERM domain-containing protein